MADKTVEEIEEELRDEMKKYANEDPLLISLTEKLFDGSTEPLNPEEKKKDD